MPGRAEVNQPSLRDKQASVHVVKFGGTSVQNAEALERVYNIVQDLKGRSPSQGLVVVLSAMGGITDLLLDATQKALMQAPHDGHVRTFTSRHEDAANALLRPGPALQQTLAMIREASTELGMILDSLRVLRELTPRASDLTVSRGERTLARLFQTVLEERGHKSSYVDATSLITVHKKAGVSFPDLDSTEERARTLLTPLLAQGSIVVCPGFIGVDNSGTLVTLGRGGSDLSATVLAHALKASNVTLYKEVDGLLTADPRHVPEARIVPEMHYREAAELAYYGAKVLHPRTIIPLLDLQIALNVKSTFKPEQPGTRIAGDVTPGAFPVKALTAAFQQALLSVEGKGMMGVPGVASRAFQALATAGISVSVISQASSEASICLVVPAAEAAQACRALNECFEHEIDAKLIDGIRAREDLAVLAAVGLGMKGTKGIAARMFGALAKVDVNIEAIAQGSSELNISVVIDQKKAATALAALHREFRLEKLKALPSGTGREIHWALLGAGQIGRALLKQVLEQKAYFQEKMALDLSCLALADSSGMVVSEHGFFDHELSAMIDNKESGGKLLPGQALPPSDLRACFAAQLWQLQIGKGIFVDATALDSAPIIMDALQAGWHVVVANKKPLAVPQDEFDHLLESARRRGLALRYEATVGAGLPILDTLAKLADAGDEVRSLSGCFSGTLGYLMTEVENGVPYSEAVAKAYALGYTEPDPREDLSGMDVARKALILARTLGLRVELKDIAVESLFPDSMKGGDTKSFIAGLKSLDAAWNERAQAARRDGRVLRYVASITPGGSTSHIKVGVEAVPAEAPLGRLKGTDNQVTLVTRRYDKNPMIVSGPGAGAAVTAAGVLNDILAIATGGERGVMDHRPLRK